LLLLPRDLLRLPYLLICDIRGIRALLLRRGYLSIRSLASRVRANQSAADPANRCCNSANSCGAKP
jgi:hypothetical protein